MIQNPTSRTPAVNQPTQEQWAMADALRNDLQRDLDRITVILQTLTHMGQQNIVLTDRQREQLNLEYSQHTDAQTMIQAKIDALNALYPPQKVGQ